MSFYFLELAIAHHSSLSHGQTPLLPTASDSACDLFVVRNILGESLQITQLLERYNMAAISLRTSRSVFLCCDAKTLFLAVSLAFVSSLVACGGSGNSNQNITVSVSPATATVFTNQMATFTATVTGSSNTSVVWSIQEGSSGGCHKRRSLYSACFHRDVPCNRHQPGKLEQVSGGDGYGECGACPKLHQHGGDNRVRRSGLQLFSDRHRPRGRRVSFGCPAGLPTQPSMALPLLGLPATLSREWRIASR